MVSTENLHLENASLPMDTKMGNKNISLEWLDLGNIYSDLFCVLSLLTLLEVFFELQPSYYALLHATHPMYILLLIYRQLSLKPLLVYSKYTMQSNPTMQVCSAFFTRMKVYGLLKMHWESERVGVENCSAKSREG